MCWNRKSDKPVCHTAVGIIQEALKWLSGGHEFKIEMKSCMACGEKMGELKVYKDPTFLTNFLNPALCLRIPIRY